MNVSEAVKSRKSVRKFLAKPVSNKLISQLLSKSSRAASGGNLQPWKIFVINDASMSDFLEFQSKWWCCPRHAGGGGDLSSKIKRTI